MLTKLFTRPESRTSGGSCERRGASYDVSCHVEAMRDAYLETMIRSGARPLA